MKMLMEKTMALEGRIMLVMCCFGIICINAGLGILLARHHWGYASLGLCLLIVWCGLSAKELKRFYQEKQSQQ